MKSMIEGAFHYTKWDKLPQIFGDELEEREENELGLVPGRGYAGQMGVGESAVYALYDPRPQEWTSQPEHWNHLKWYTGPILLEIDLPKFLQTNIGLRSIFVGDWKVAAEGQDNIETAQTYQQSFVSLVDYNKDPTQYPFSLPELQIRTHIPKEFVKVSEIQPNLEAKIDNWFEDLEGKVGNAISLEKAKFKSYKDIAIKIRRTHSEFITMWWESYQQRQPIKAAFITDFYNLYCGLLQKN